MYSRFSMWLAVPAFVAVMAWGTPSLAQDCDVYLTVSETPTSPVVIPDFNYEDPVTRSLSVGEHFTICEVIVDLDIAPGHEGCDDFIFNGDIRLDLRHEVTGEQIRLIDQIGSPPPPTGMATSVTEFT